jgi:hypothetical protein
MVPSRIRKIPGGTSKPKRLIMAALGLAARRFSDRRSVLFGGNPQAAQVMDVSFTGEVDGGRPGVISSKMLRNMGKSGEI